MSFTISHSLEDAIVATKFGKFSNILITLSGLILACSMLEATSVNMIIPIAQCELNMNNFHKGLLGSMNYVGIILSSHFWGFMADTKGRKKVIVSALFLSFSFTVCSTLVKNFWLLVLFRFLTGFCICAPQAIMYAFLGEFHSSRYRARSLITASVMYGIFCLINPLNGILFLNQESWSFHIPILDIEYNAWRIFLLMCGFPSIISAILVMIYIPESPRFTYAQGDEARTLRILQRIHTVNTGIREFPVKSLIRDEEFQQSSMSARNCSFFRFMWSQTVPLFQHPHLKNTLTACFLQFGICVTGNGFWTFFPEIVNKVTIWLDKSSPEARSTICQIVATFDANVTVAEPLPVCVTKLELETFQNVAMLLVLFSVGWFIISVVINRVGKLVVILCVMFMCGSASILLVFIDYPRVALYIYVVMLTSGLNMSVVNTSTVELFPTTLRAMAVSISLMFGRLGSVAGSNFVGLAIKNFCTYTWILPAVLLISGGFLAFTIPNINKRDKSH